MDRDGGPRSTAVGGKGTGNGHRRSCSIWNNWLTGIWVARPIRTVLAIKTGVSGVCRMQRQAATIFAANEIAVCHRASGSRRPACMADPKSVAVHQTQGPCRSARGWV